MLFKRELTIIFKDYRVNHVLC